MGVCNVVMIMVYIYINILVKCYFLNLVIFFVIFKFFKFLKFNYLDKIILQLGF